MIVTLDVFSGKPNPSWKLSQKDARSFLERFANKSIDTASEVDNTLGYRGVIVAATSDDQLPDGIPTDFRVGGNAMGDAVAQQQHLPGLDAEEAGDAVQWLLSKGQHALNEEVLAHVTDNIQMQNSGVIDTFPMEMEEDITEQELRKPQAAACVIQNTAYNPGFWNVPTVQPYNNCYNYAMNHRSNTFAQPGRQTGHMYTALNCPNVCNAALWDGNKLACTGLSKNVALVIWPNVDYHWYRRHSEGFWGHKPGRTAARNTDNSGRVINGSTLTPFNCNRGPYTIFCNYLYSPAGIVVK